MALLRAAHRPHAAEIEDEKKAGQADGLEDGARPRIVADFHGRRAAEAAEAEWRRVHQARQAPSEMRVVRVAAGEHKPHDLLVAAALAKSNSEAVRLLRQRAVRRDGVVLEAAEIELRAGESFVLSVGPARHVRIEAL